jgi:hypothetical protein
MAKENFERTKPHVNIGTVSQIVTDTSGQLTLGGLGDDVAGNPAPSTKLFFSAPGSGDPESFVVAYPFDTDFTFVPADATCCRQMTMDFAVDILPLDVTGTPGMEVTLAILQDEVFIADGQGTTIDDTNEGNWLTVSHTGITFDRFNEADGGLGHPDPTRAFQFGYAFLGDYSTGGLNVELNVDNMNVGITFVPEPMSITIALILCGGALLCRRGLIPTMR